MLPWEIHTLQLGKQVSFLLWEQGHQSLGTGLSSFGNRVIKLWEQGHQSLGTGLSIFGNKAINLWEKGYQSLGTGPLSGRPHLYEKNGEP
jgi:hypothetical protein